jgi:hypothetical protein
MNIENFRVPEGKKLNLKNHPTDLRAITPTKRKPSKFEKKRRAIGGASGRALRAEHARAAFDFSGDGRRRERRRD